MWSDILLNFCKSLQYLADNSDFADHLDGLGGTPEVLRNTSLQYSHNADNPPTPLSLSLCFLAYNNLRILEINVKNLPAFLMLKAE